MAGFIGLGAFAALFHGAGLPAARAQSASPVRTLPAGTTPTSTDSRAAEVVASVDAAAALIQQKGQAAFIELRDPRGRFYRGENYVFVTTPEGVELVNPAMPVLEGTNLLQVRDTDNHALVADYIRLAMTQGSGWTSYRWFRPAPQRTPVRKHTYVRRVVAPGGEVLVVGSGYYTPDSP